MVYRLCKAKYGYNMSFLYRFTIKYFITYKMKRSVERVFSKFDIICKNSCQSVFANVSCDHAKNPCRMFQFPTVAALYFQTAINKRLAI